MNCVQWLRIVGLTEGASYLILLFVAMPLKYLAGRPEAVRVVGMAHGLLFIALCALLLYVMQRRNWSFKKAGVVFLAALVPFGPLFIDRQLREDAKS